MNDLISVIVPVYKVECYLHKCVDSIINQTYKNLEIILVDDGSPDNCPKICDDYAKRDSRIKVIHKKNGGLSSARNAGLDIASGNYIGFIDSDDYISPHMYEELYFALINTNSDISMCNFDYIDESYNNLFFDSPIADEELNKKDIISKLFIDKYWYYVIACNKLYKKELFTNLRYPIREIHEDEGIIHHLYLKCNKVTTISSSYYYYVQRNDSIMGKGKSIKSLIKYQFFAERINLCKCIVSEDVIIKAINKFLWSFFDDYYLFQRSNKKNIYIHKAKKAFENLLPIIFKYKVVSKKELFSFFVFYLNSDMYKYLFRKGVKE